MPDHWDTKPENLFSVPGDQPDPAHNGHDDPTNEVKLRDPAAGSGCPPTS